jgi:hypothetical protein
MAFSLCADTPHRRTLGLVKSTNRHIESRTVASDPTIASSALRKVPTEEFRYQIVGVEATGSCFALRDQERQPIDSQRTPRPMSPLAAAT